MPNRHDLPLIVCILVWLLALPTALYAQSNARVYRLLILDSQIGNPYDEIRSALLTGLAKQGYLPGENLQISLHAAGNDIGQGEQILREQRQQAYDVIFVSGTIATISAQKVWLGHASQPVIFAAPTDPVGIGVIKDFDTPPYANFTGVCYPVPAIARLRFIRRLMPKAKTFGLIYADMPQSHSYNQWLQQLLVNDPTFKDIKIIFSPVQFVAGENGDQLMADAAIKNIRLLNDQVDAFIKPNDQMGTRRSFAQVLYQNASKPLIGIVKDDVMQQWGAAAVVYPSHASIGEQAAVMIGQLFAGKRVQDIPPQWPQKYGFAIDLPKARQYGLTVPVELLLLAGENIIK